MPQLDRVSVRGFKSIRALEDFELRGLNVLIGANGAGKSNLVSFFKMLNEMMAGRLQTYIAKVGRAQALLRYGPKHTPEMEATLEFEADGARYIYYQQLSYAAGDTLVFSEESVGADATTMMPALTARSTDCTSGSVAAGS